MPNRARGSDSDAKLDDPLLAPLTPGARVLAHASATTADAHGSFGVSHAQRLAAFAFALGIGWLGHRIEQSWTQRDTLSVASMGSNARPKADVIKLEPRTLEPLARVKPQPRLARTHDPKRSAALDPQPGAKRDPEEIPTLALAAGESTAAAAVAAPTHVTAPFSLASDAKILESLRKSAVRRIKKGTGGRSLAFKITLVDGTQGYFKPEQQVSSANWYSEVASYYLDRALGLGRVPPVVSRSFAWSKLAPAATDDPRVSEVIVGRDGQVRGAFVHWLSGTLAPAQTPPGWENWVRVETFARTAVSPYQRAAAFGAQLGAARVAASQREPPRSHYSVVPNPTSADLPAALSDMIVFDFLTLNYDRWGGDNANVLTLARGASRELIYLDNGDGFSVGPARRSLLDARLSKLQRFRKSTLEALRKLDLAAFGKQLAADTHAPILDGRMLEGLAVRQRAVLDHVAAQERRFGSSVYAW